MVVMMIYNDVIIASIWRRCHVVLTCNNDIITPGVRLNVMTCQLFFTKPLPELMLTECQSNPWLQTSVDIQKIFREQAMEKENGNGKPLYSGLGVLKLIVT